MKRRYIPVSTKVRRDALVVTVEVQEIGPRWGFDIVLPWHLIDQKAAYEAAELEHERVHRWALHQGSHVEDVLW